MFVLFKADNESEMKNWVTAIDVAATAVIVDERKDVNKLRKFTSFRFVNPCIFIMIHETTILQKQVPDRSESCKQE